MDSISALYEPVVEGEEASWKFAGACSACEGNFDVSGNYFSAADNDHVSRAYLNCQIRISISDNIGVCENRADQTRQASAVNEFTNINVICMNLPSGRPLHKNGLRDPFLK